MPTAVLQALPKALITRPFTRFIPRSYHLRLARYTSTQPSPPHDVVSSFLCTGIEGTPSFRICLLKRSDKVKVYKTLYAALSGSIQPSDPSPLAAALREIGEETGLAPPDIELLREGAGYELSDEVLGKVWRIWPFAFTLKDPQDEEQDGGGGGMGSEGEGGGGDLGNRGDEEGREGRLLRLRGMMKLDWENVDVVFVRPEEVVGMRTVPELERGVRAVVRGHFCAEGGGR